MKYDHALITGMFIGLTVGLWYMESLVAYLPFFLLGAVIFLMGYMHSHR